jgi:hypothetical protein
VTAWREMTFGETGPVIVDGSKASDHSIAAKQEPK